MIYINDCDIFVGDANLNIIGRKKLIIPHVVRFDPHKSGGVICLGIAVSFITADRDLFNILFKLAGIFYKFLIMALLNRFAVASSVNELGFLQLIQFSILFCRFPDVLGSVFCIDTESDICVL